MTATSLVSDQHAFIAYRRECGTAALELARAMRRSGRAVFRDIEALRGGEIWTDTVRAAIEKANAVIVMIDRSWHAAESGKRDPRLWTEHDSLRMELRHAIKHRIALLPVLVDDTPLPQPAELPLDIRALCERHALRLRHTEFEVDAKRIAADVDRMASLAQPANDTVPAALERRTVLDRLSAFKPSALRESLSNAKPEDLRSILTRLSRTGTPTPAEPPATEADEAREQAAPRRSPSSRPA